MKDFFALLGVARSSSSTLAISLDTVSFPTEERCGLTSQLRRHVTSIASKVAEG